MPTQSAGCMLLRLLLCNIWYMCICAQHLPVVAIFNSPWNSVSGLHTYRNKIWMLLFLFMYRNIVLYLWYAVYCVAEQTVYLVWCFHHPNLIPLKSPIAFQICPRFNNSASLNMLSLVHVYMSVHY